MRKRIFPRLRTLLTAACVSLYTKRTGLAKSNCSVEPRRIPVQPDTAEGLNCFLFETDAHIAAETTALSAQMNTLTDSLTDLRDMLAFMSTPFPVETMTQTPCAIMHHDSDLFEGEPIAIPPQQDTTIGGAADFLFGDAPIYDDHSAQHAA